MPFNPLIWRFRKKVRFT
ncbi:hypothetical protein CGLO_13743 [Colletotrichum gloeosporioides Cg-14]|uniref:Uncharacterized protein n=1 Tax=Colletotrichum gloeosporioides (strain Cg-14) TaxID=1237896 RepID=T0LFV5_COLGC|nr:hypothetical protein CGLO_13743 [Colletotrichum gloeosporioides Cg-14]